MLETSDPVRILVNVKDVGNLVGKTNIRPFKDVASQM